MLPSYNKSRKEVRAIRSIGKFNPPPSPPAMKRSQYFISEGSKMTDTYFAAKISKELPELQSSDAIWYKICRIQVKKRNVCSGEVSLSALFLVSYPCISLT